VDAAANGSLNSIWLRAPKRFSYTNSLETLDGDRPKPSVITASSSG
jgi:hypothetical protein